MSLVIIIWLGILKLEKEDAEKEEVLMPNPFKVLKDSIR